MIRSARISRVPLQRSCSMIRRENGAQSRISHHKKKTIK
jgi:hypothetical protein